MKTSSASRTSSNRKRPGESVERNGDRADSRPRKRSLFVQEKEEENAFASLEALLQSEPPVAIPTTKAPPQKQQARQPKSKSHDQLLNHPPLSPSSLSSTSESPVKPTAPDSSAAGKKRSEAPRKALESTTFKPATKASLLGSTKSTKTAPKVIQATKSIVGTRPKHWTSATIKTKSDHLGFAQPNRRRREADLEAELNRTASPLPPQGRTRPFLPTFLSRSTPANEDIQEPADDEDVRTTTVLGRSFPAASSPPTPTTTPKQKSSKKGPLAKRMQALRDAAKGDEIRLHSGQYPFSLRSTDRNDPRNRATSITTVTVLGTPVPHQKHLVSALCYLHEWKSQQQQPGPPAGALVWVIFRAATPTLQAGAQLRLYNAMAVPLRRNDDKWVVFHTFTSEQYPAQLPALKDVTEWMEAVS